MLPCSDVADTCHILQRLDRYLNVSPNHIACYSDLVPDCTVNDLAFNHWLMHATTSEMWNVSIALAVFEL